MAVRDKADGLVGLGGCDASLGLLAAACGVNGGRGVMVSLMDPGARTR